MPRRLLVQISAVGMLIFVMTVAGQPLLDDRFDVAQQTISEFVHSSAAVAVLVGFGAWSLSLAALAAALVSVGGPAPVVRLIRAQVAALLLAALALVVLAIFPTDRGADVPAMVERMTAAGAAHDAASALVTASLLAAATFGALWRDGWLRVLTLALVALGLFTSALLLVGGDPVPGARQRTLVGVAFVWQAAWLLDLWRGGTTWARSSAGY